MHPAHFHSDGANVGPSINLMSGPEGLLLSVNRNRAEYFTYQGLLPGDHDRYLVAVAGDRVGHIRGVYED